MRPTPTSRRMPDEVPLLEAVGITKLYGDFVANDGINLEIWPAEVHALLGENGAGKSTLVKMIYGLLQPTRGEFSWQGEPIVLAGPAAARARGIGMVFQHFSLFEQLTVAENVALGLDNAPLAGHRRARRRGLAQPTACRSIPKREVWRLSVGERQRIEIVRCLLQDPKLLILDEPTSVLTPQEAEQLFRTLRVLRKEGRAILYISHKLEEVRALCDTATILRGGKVIATCDPRAETAQSLARMMVGGEVGAVRSDGAKKLGQPRLVRAQLSTHARDPHGVKLDGITFELAAGEILGLAGVAGNGQDELFAALSGEALVANAERDPDRQAAMPAGSRSPSGGGSAPPSCRRSGSATRTAPRFRLSDNALISGHAASPMVRRGFIDRGAGARLRRPHHQGLSTCARASRDPEAVSLSGGNLQKYVVGREILREPRLLVVSQPTWGVDAGAAAAIRQALIDLAARGAAVLVMSQDLDELYEISDRLVVICARAAFGAAPDAPRRSRRDRHADGGASGMKARAEAAHAARA